MTRASWILVSLAAASVWLAACAKDEPSPTGLPTVNASPSAVAKAGPKDGPGIEVNPNPHSRGNAAAGKDVFRFETFGNEGFWTDAMRLPQGMVAAKVTVLDALKAGLQFDIEAVPAALKDKLASELKTDLSPGNAPTLHDPKAMVSLVEANAVGGLVPKDSNGDGKIDLAGGDKLGIACTICHVRTDGSIYEMAKGGSVGKRIDGLAAVNLDTGKLLAIAANSRAYYPNLQGTFLGVSIGRAKSGLGANSTEAEVDAYLTNHDNYPVGTFDETQDLNGNPVMNTPLFRQDLAAPYGSAGEFAKLEDISNSRQREHAGREARSCASAVARPRAQRRLFLHDASVNGLPSLLDPQRGEDAPHPFYVNDPKVRTDVVAFLRALDTFH